MTRLKLECFKIELLLKYPKVALGHLVAISQLEAGSGTVRQCHHLRFQRALFALHVEQFLHSHIVIIV